MSKSSRKIQKVQKATIVSDYDIILSGVVELLEAARHASARSVNAIMTATYWEIGRRMVEFEQEGERRADYGAALLKRLSSDLTSRFGRGFSVDNLQFMRSFYLTYPYSEIYETLSRKSLDIRAPGHGQTQKYETLSRILPGEAISQTVSGKSGIPAPKCQTPSGQLGCLPQEQKIETPSEKSPTPSAEFGLREIAVRFPLPWSHYVRLLSVKKPDARAFYEAEALRCGWSVRQLDRQVSTLFYERTLLSRNKAAMLRKGEKPRPGEPLTPEEELKDPLVLEFLGLKDDKLPMPRV